MYSRILYNRGAFGAMKLLDLQSFCYSTNDQNKFIILNMNNYKFERSNYDLGLKDFKRFGATVVKWIPVVGRNGHIQETNFNIFNGHRLTICKYKDIVFGTYGNLLVFEKDTFRKGLYYLLKYIHINRNTLPRPPAEPTKTLVERFREFIGHQYINKDTKAAIVDALVPFIGTYSKRRIFDINMCLSVVFSGAPGDGKTYAATQIVKWVSRNLDLKAVAEEANIFKEVSKLAPDFVGLIDDMNVSHFQREGNGGICQNILSEMDRPNCNRLFLLTTNEVVNRSNVDAAFFRPGRIQNIIQFDKPDRHVKESVIDSLVRKLANESISLDKEFVAGAKIFTEEQDLSLAEMMRLTNLVITDIIMETKLVDPRTYIKNAKSVQTEESYSEAVSI